MEATHHTNTSSLLKFPINHTHVNGNRNVHHSSKAQLNCYTTGTWFNTLPPWGTSLLRMVGTENTIHQLGLTGSSSPSKGQNSGIKSIMNVSSHCLPFLPPSSFHAYLPFLPSFLHRWELLPSFREPAWGCLGRTGTAHLIQQLCHSPTQTNTITMAGRKSS